MLSLKNVSKTFKKRVPSGNKIKDFFSPSFDKFEALKNISFDVKQGEKVAFIGPNGAGKSTTIKTILGILHYDEGEITLFGKDPRKDRVEISKQVSSVFGQRSQLLYHLPLIDSFNFFKIIYEIPDQLFKDRMNKLVSQFKIGEFIDSPVRKLSLGQRMKGEIIAGLLHGPKAIFLDEPTVGLDIIAKKTLHEVLLGIHREENITIFLTSHDLKDVEVLCDRTIVINKGEILYDGEIKKLFSTYGNKKVIKYKTMDSLDWTVIEVENSPAVLKTQITEIFDRYEVEDLQVENIPLEEIIEKFYN